MKKTKKSIIWDWTKKILGILLILIGLIGLIFPIMQGWIFIFLGLALLGNKRIKNFFSELWKKTKKTIKAKP
jgi:uncharacterized protein YqgC (DUF456 family)